MRWNGRPPRPAVPGALVLVGSLSLALVPFTAPLVAQEAPLEQLLVEPMAWEVEEAADVLRRYLAVKEAERARAAEAAGDPISPELADELPGSADLRQVTAAAAAPGLGAASLTISDQLHLADTSALFKDGAIFLWDESSGGNLALGRNALAVVNESVNDNTAVGTAALAVNSTGVSNTAHGRGALGNNQSGAGNTATGAFALYDNLSGNSNTAVGRNALLNNATGQKNVAIGFQAGLDAPVDASENIFIAHQAMGDESNPTIRIGTDGVQTRAFVAGIYLAGLAGSATHEVCVDDLGQLGACPTISSLRFKQDVTPLGAVTESLLELEPVSFRYREGVLGGPDTVHFGLIAEEVAEVLPELVVRDADGAPFAVRYELLSVLLLGELRHRHEIDARQEASLESLQRRLAELEDRRPSE